MFTKIFLGIFAIALTSVLPVTASAQANSDGWEVCNDSSYIIEAATGRYEGQGVVVQGWKRLRPGACEKVIEGPLQPGIHYLFGRSSTAHRGGRKVWAGKSNLCIDPTGSFAVENIPNCSVMGLESREFRPVLIESSKRWRTSFTETDKRNLEQASAARGSAPARQCRGLFRPDRRLSRSQDEGGDWGFPVLQGARCEHF
ncbi:MAG: DUF1036 domain-containing protein [Hyphomonas sp.]|nr:DUF1036 domain-containing protein [Hyphomonas sp.]